jgi:hypothetical protein
MEKFPASVDGAGAGHRRPAAQGGVGDPQRRFHGAARIRAPGHRIALGVGPGLHISHHRADRPVPYRHLHLIPRPQRPVIAGPAPARGAQPHRIEGIISVRVAICPALDDQLAAPVDPHADARVGVGPPGHVGVRGVRGRVDVDAGVGSLGREGGRPHPFDRRPRPPGLPLRPQGLGVLPQAGQRLRTLNEGRPRRQGQGLQSPRSRPEHLHGEQIRAQAEALDPPLPLQPLQDLPQRAGGGLGQPEHGRLSAQAVPSLGLRHRLRRRRREGDEDPLGLRRGRRRGLGSSARRPPAQDQEGQEKAGGKTQTGEKRKRSTLRHRAPPLPSIEARGASPEGNPGSVLLASGSDRTPLA